MSIELLKKSLEFVETFDDLPSTSREKEKNQKQKKKKKNRIENEEMSSELLNLKKIFIPKRRPQTKSVIEEYNAKPKSASAQKNARMANYIRTKAIVDNNLLKDIVKHYEKPHNDRKRALKKAESEQTGEPGKKKKRTKKPGLTNADFKAWAKEFSASKGVRL